MRKGNITQIIAAVVDAKFDGELPEILTALECDNNGNRPVSYTHLTLPTIYSV